MFGIMLGIVDLGCFRILDEFTMDLLIFGRVLDLAVRLDRVCCFFFAVCN